MLRINLQHEAESQEMSQVVTHCSFGRAVGTVSERHSGEVSLLLPPIPPPVSL